jgi:hypothetical protein
VQREKSKKRESSAYISESSVVLLVHRSKQSERAKILSVFFQSERDTQ